MKLFVFTIPVYNWNVLQMFLVSYLSVDNALTSRYFHSKSQACHVDAT